VTINRDKLEALIRGSRKRRKKHLSEVMRRPEVKALLQERQNPSAREAAAKGYRLKRA
jgi:hypothetical protein